MSRPRKQIVLRDDDLNFFTDPVQLEKAYGFLFERQIPVKFSTIPAADAQATTESEDFGVGSYEQFLLQSEAGKKELSPITENKQLLDIVSDSERVEFLLHGYCHNGVDGRYEFETEDAVEIADELDQGCAILEQAFGRLLTTFVAPQGKYSGPAFEQIRRRFEIFSLGWIDRRRISMKLLPAYVAMKARKTNRIRSGGMQILEHPSCLFSKFRSVSDCANVLHSHIAANDLIVIVVHYWKFFQADGSLNTELHDAFCDRVLALEQRAEYDSGCFPSFDSSHRQSN